MKEIFKGQSFIPLFPDNNNTHTHTHKFHPPPLHTPLKERERERGREERELKAREPTERKRERETGNGTAKFRPKMNGETQFCTVPTNQSVRRTHSSHFPTRPKRA